MKKKIPLIIGNWKMNLNCKIVKQFLTKLKSKAYNIECKFGIAAPYVYLNELISQKVPKMIICAQDVHYAEKGAFTGCISYSQLKDVKVKWSLIGHSERRNYFNETNELVNKKVISLLSNSMIPIICIGETKEEFDKKITKQVVSNQIKQALKNVNESLVSKVVIAYEPIWAIGTGKTASVEIAQKVISYARSVISNLYNKNIAEKIYILYGGSVNSKNVKDLINQPDIDGGLVGNASLEINSFLSLLNECTN